MGMANSTGNQPESYPAEHFIGKPECQCEPCRAWFDGWNAGHTAGQGDARVVADRKHNIVSSLRSVVSESHAAGDRKTLGEALDALCALAGNSNALMTAGARKFLIADGRCVKCGTKIGLNESDHLSTCDKCIGDIPDDIAEVVRSAFVSGMDKCREIKDAYGEWPSLPGRVELADDYVSTLTLLGPDDHGSPTPAQHADKAE